MIKDEELQEIYNNAIDGAGKTVFDGLRAVYKAAAIFERERCAKIVDMPPGTEAWEVIGGEEGLMMLRELAMQIRGA